MRTKDEILTQFDDYGESTAPFQRLMPPPIDEATDLFVSIPAGEYSASRLAHAVEDCNAHLLFLNVMNQPNDDGWLSIALRVNRMDGIAVARSLERYGYTVTDIQGTTGTVSESLSDRTREFLHLLEV